MPALHDAAQSLLDLLFPPRCVACRRGGAVLCSACRATIRSPQPPLCAHCGQSLALLPPGRATAMCPACAGEHGPQALTALYAASVYDGAARQAIHALKYAGRCRMAQPLGDPLATEARRVDVRPELIVPVPLHAGRLRERGYNQAALLARRYAARLGVPCRADLLARVRATPPQVGLSLVERRANVRDAFALAEGAGQSLAGKRVLLIDDVATTGSTLDAAAAALRLAAPAAILGMAVSRPDLADGAPDRDALPLATARWASAGRPFGRGQRGRA
jgi:ComF family protein